MDRPVTATPEPTLTELMNIMQAMMTKVNSHDALAAKVQRLETKRQERTSLGQEGETLPDHPGPGPLASGTGQGAFQLVSEPSSNC